MTTRQEALDYGLSMPYTYQEAPFHDPNWQLVRVHGSKKAFLWTYEKDGYIHLNVKVDPQWRDYWRGAFASVIPGYHQNKEHWNTIILDGTIPDETIKCMIAESYDLVSDSPTKRIYEAVKKIPQGKVATYGQVAALAGNPGMCRAVGNALHKNSGPGACTLLPGSQFQRRAVRGICLWRCRTTGEAAAGRRNRSKQWQSRSAKIWNCSRRG